MVSRPRHRHHPAQCLCRHCLRPADPRRPSKRTSRTRACPTSSRPAATRSPSSSRTRSSSGRTSRASTRPGPTSTCRRSRGPRQPLVCPRLRSAHRWDVGTTGGLHAARIHRAIPEFFGDTMLVNGTVFPQVTVQARRYRLRLLNACQRPVPQPAALRRRQQPERHHAGCKRLPHEHGVQQPRRRRPTVLAADRHRGGLPGEPGTGPEQRSAHVPGAARTRSGDGADRPLEINKSLLVAPAERPDVIVDFKGYEGKSIILYTDAPAPFPGGGPETDYFPGLDNGNPVNANTPNGFGPNTRVLMRFNVVPAQAFRLNIDHRHVDRHEAGPRPVLHRSGRPEGRSPRTSRIPARFLTLNEYFDEYGRLIQILGNAAAPSVRPTSGRRRTWTTRLERRARPRRTSMPATRKSGRSTTPPATCTRCISTW